MTQDIRIFVVCHKPTYIIENPLLTPIQVGAKYAREHIAGMLHDDVNENISSKNAFYCELTAQYWAWKNVQTDYYGFFHYRRYLSFQESFSIGQDGKVQSQKRIRPYIELDDIREDLSEYGLNADRMRAVIEDFDLLTVCREKINTTVYRQYCEYHPKEALDCVLKILVREYPEYYEAMKEYLDSKEIYYMNMYIMKKKVFLEYAPWLFDILGKFEQEVDSLSCGFQKERLMGYLAERLFGIFYTYQRRRGVKCAELPYLRFYNTDVGEEGKISEHIRRFRLKPTKMEISIDMKRLNKLFPPGTYRRILLRNIFLR